MMYGPDPARINASPDASFVFYQDTNPKRLLQQILSPFPHSTRIGLDNPPYGNHMVIAEGADFDVPHRNAWIIPAQSQDLPFPLQELPRPQVMVELEDGTWEKRAQSPEPVYEDESDGEILYLDSDIMERNLDTGFIGECGRAGCRRVLGCVDCKGKRPKAPTLSKFSEAAENSSPMKDMLPEFSNTANDPAPDPWVKTNQPFSTNLQRSGTIPVVVPLNAPASYSKSTLPPPRTGPKIKYIRKRAVDTSIKKAPAPNRARTRRKRRKLV